jgi:hypothetical protein
MRRDDETPIVPLTMIGLGLVFLWWIQSVLSYFAN